MLKGRLPNVGTPASFTVRLSMICGGTVGTAALSTFASVTRVL